MMYLLLISYFLVLFYLPGFTSFNFIKGNLLKSQNFHFSKTFKRENLNVWMIANEPLIKENGVLKPPTLPVSPWSVNYEVNRPFIIALLIGQGILLNVGLALGYFTSTDVLNFKATSFDIDSMTLAYGLGFAMYATGAIIDRMPYTFFQQVSSGTTLYSLFLIGRSPSILKAMLVSFLISLTAAISEEVFFRGFVYQAIEGASNTPIAVFASAAIFGFAHFPLNVSNALLEAILGGALSVAYGATGNNIAVPIAMHFVYDFLTIFIAWASATNRLESVIKSEEESMKNIFSLGPEEFNKLAKSIFLAIDKNENGRIDYDEFNTAVEIQRIDSMPLWSVAPKAFLKLQEKVLEKSVDFETFKDIIKKARY